MSLSVEMKEKIRTLGNSGETYDDSIRRMYEITSNTMRAHALRDDANAVPIKEAITEAQKR